MKTAYRHGIHESNRELVVDRLPVEGRLPEWLEGTLLRNGPGSFEAGRQRYRHWFDGFAMLHRFSFAGGQVSYASRFLDTEVRRTAEAEGRITYSEFATDPCRSLFKRVMTVFTPKVSDNAKVSLTRHAEQFIALAETPLQVRFDPATLESAGVVAYEKALVGQMTTAHPHLDEGLLYNLVIRFGALSRYHIDRVASDMTTTTIGSVRASRPAYMHSFGMSPRHAVITEFPLVVNPIDLLLWLRPFIENFRWQPKRGAPFHLVDRDTGRRNARVDSDPFFAFHHVNAFERGRELVVDLVGYDDAGIVMEYYLNRLAAEDIDLPPGTLRRAIVPLDGGRVQWETLSDVPLEMPHIHYAGDNMRQGYRAVYGIGVRPDRPHEFYNRLVRIDVADGSHRAWQADDCYPGEPVFVPAPGGGSGEGVILTVVLDAAAGTSFLLALDAASLGEVARATLPQAVLFGFHGAFFGQLASPPPGRS
jgi:beta,beta-carotene 9',10'-dioxygenase